jgi:hypothetical protein
VHAAQQWPLCCIDLAYCMLTSLYTAVVFVVCCIFSVRFVTMQCENPYAHQLTGVQEAEDDSSASVTERDDAPTNTTNTSTNANGDTSSNK